MQQGVAFSLKNRGVAFTLTICHKKETAEMTVSEKVTICNLFNTGLQKKKEVMNLSPFLL